MTDDSGAMLFSVTGPFQVGFLTRSMADELNQMRAKLAALDGLAGVSPVVVYRGPNGQPVIGLGPGGETLLRGKLDAELSPGGSATMSVWAANSGGTDVDTGDDITLYEWMLQTGQTVASGAEAWAGWDARSKRWYLVSAECD